MPSVVTKTNRGDRVAEEVQQRITTTCEFALITPGDYIRDARAPFRLWSVDSVQICDYNGKPITQTASCKQEESGHPLNTAEMPEFDLPTEAYYIDNRGPVLKTIRDSYEELVSKIKYPASSP